MRPDAADQRIVAQTTTMSTEASGMLRIPNWMGVNRRLAARLNANVKATPHGTRRRIACTRTKPKLTAMTG
jgi:hypothetical protein